MKKRIAALALALTLALTGCSSLLEREYFDISRYEPVSVGENNLSALRVETYQGLVNAILYLVSEGAEQGVLNLHNYNRDVADDLARACREVIQEDPLGAYAVDYIRHDFSRIVSYYEVNIYISYRRTPEQINSIVRVTGSSAIRQALSQTLSTFSPETVLRVSYFSEDEDYILNLAHQAYYDAPATAMGMPKIAVSVHPATGYQKIVEITLDYPDSPAVLRRHSQELSALTPELSSTPEELYTALQESLTIDLQSGGSTAHAALIEGSANSEGAALAYKLLCDRAGFPCTVVCGQLDGRAHFWNIISQDGIYRHLDLTSGLFALTDAELTEAGAYQWNLAEYPSCTPTPSEK